MTLPPSRAHVVLTETRAVAESQGCSKEISQPSKALSYVYVPMFSVGKTRLCRIPFIHLNMIPTSSCG